MLIYLVRPKPERQVQQIDCASWDLEPKMYTNKVLCMKNKQEEKGC